MEDRGPQRSQDMADTPPSTTGAGAAEHNGAASVQTAQSIAPTGSASLQAIQQASKTGPSAEFNMMLRGLLHELRNPLSSILTAANLVDDTARESNEVSEETSMLLGVIKKESLRLNRILTEFSNYIKLPDPQPSVFDFAQLTRDVASQLQDENIIAADVVILDNLPHECFVWADKSQIRTALHHLMRNSGEAMPESGQLHLTLREEPDKAVVCVGDNGQGFSAESKERAFQPFYSTKLHGTGLGLPAALAIIEAAGGRLWIESESTPVASTSSNNESGEAAIKPAVVQLCIALPRRSVAEDDAVKKLQSDR